LLPRISSTNAGTAGSPISRSRSNARCRRSSLLLFQKVRSETCFASLTQWLSGSLPATGSSRRHATANATQHKTAIRATERTFIPQTDCVAPADVTSVEQPQILGHAGNLTSTTANRPACVSVALTQLFLNRGM
jgi:hypothetical protein